MKKHYMYVSFENQEEMENLCCYHLYSVSSHPFFIFILYLFAFAMTVPDGIFMQLCVFHLKNVGKPYICCLFIFEHIVCIYDIYFKARKMYLWLVKPTKKLGSQFGDSWANWVFLSLFFWTTSTILLTPTSYIIKQLTIYI